MKERGQKRFPILIPQMAAEASLGWTIAGSKELQPGLLPWQGCNHWGHRLLACLCDSQEARLDMEQSGLQPSL